MDPIMRSNLLIGDNYSPNEAAESAFNIKLLWLVWTTTLSHVSGERRILKSRQFGRCSGLVAAEEADQPFEFCNVVSTTTHKSLRGPRAGMIFFRRV
jgi:hypothetical protein